MLFVGDAAAWLDSTPQIRYIVDNKATATATDLKEFEDALKEQFPAALTTVPEISAQAQMDPLAQEASEPLAAFYQRVVNILRRTHGRDHPRTTESTASVLTGLEEFTLGCVVNAFVRGLSAWLRTVTFDSHL